MLQTSSGVTEAAPGGEHGAATDGWTDRKAGRGSAVRPVLDATFCQTRPPSVMNTNSAATSSRGGASPPKTTRAVQPAMVARPTMSPAGTRQPGRRPIAAPNSGLTAAARITPAIITAPAPAALNRAA